MLDPLTYLRVLIRSHGVTDFVIQPDDASDTLRMRHRHGPKIVEQDVPKRSSDEGLKAAAAQFVAAVRSA